jgi:hypothetical protein
VDRGRLAASALTAPHRRDRLAGAPPGDLRCRHSLLAGKGANW